MERAVPAGRPASREEYAIVLDFLQNGHPFEQKPGQRAQPIAQGIGCYHYSILEMTPRRDVVLQPSEEVYIGDGKRDRIHHVLGKIPLDKLTPAAHAELETALGTLVQRNEARFVAFFNNSQPLSTRMHQIELLPGFGKKHMWEIIETRRDKPFASFADMRERVRLMPDPVKAIVKRLINEIAGTEKHRLFTEA